MTGDTIDDAIREAAAAKIYAERDAILRDQKRVKEQQAELAARERELDRKMAECRAAARFFDLTDIDFDPERGPALRRLAENYHNRALALRAEGQPEIAARYITRSEMYFAQAREAEAQSALHFAQRTEEKPTETKTGQLSTPKPPRVRDVALDVLRNSDPVGAKAADIKRYIETTYSTQLHDKTVGMTLFRLSKERPPAVHRKGQIWFFGPPGESPLADPENPGADTPGETHDAD